MKLLKLTLLLSISLSANAEEPNNLKESWYIGGAVGQSSLNPDGGALWSVTDDSALSKKVYTGVGITKDAGIEAFWSDLGESSLKSASGKGQIKYKVAGVAGVYKPQVKFAGVRPLAKLGLAKITTKDKGDVVSHQLHNTSIFLGLGAEYPLTSNINLRAEYERYDKDIESYNLGVNWRPLQRNRRNIVETVAMQSPAPAVEYIAPAIEKPRPVVKQYTPPVTIVEKPKYIAPKQKFVAPKPQVQIIHSSLSGGSNFSTASTQLTYIGKNRLNKLAEDLQADGMKIKSIMITGHTDSVGDNASNQSLSIARADTVANYLQGLGVNQNVMRTNGLGESQPIASNNTKQGRAQNRRVEIVIKGIRTVIKQ